MLKKYLSSGTALSSVDFNQRLLLTLANDSAAQKKIVMDALQATSMAPERLKKIFTGEDALTFSELVQVLKELNKQGLSVNPASLAAKDSVAPPFAQKSFYDSLTRHFEDIAALKAQLSLLREDSRKEKGYLKTVFGIFSSSEPIEKIVENAESFDKYCRKNGITFDEANQTLVNTQKSSPLWGKIKEYRFLIAAAGGMGLGLAGADLSKLPVMSQSIGAFFGLLPWLAAPFIGLNIFKSFADNSMVKAAPTLMRFAGTTALGLATSFVAVWGMQHLLSVVNPSNIQGMAQQMTSGGGFSPMQWMLPIMGAFGATALVYKRAQNALAGTFNQISDKAGFWPRAYNAYDKTMNQVMRAPAPFIVAAGKWGEKATEGINKIFPRFIDVIGIPAIATLTSMTMAQGGFGLLGQFANYYATAFAGLGLGTGVMMGLYAACGCRGKDFNEVFSAMKDGFSISSSSACMPKEREVLEKIGVSAATRDTVVPLGGVFNMFGTSLYMGLTAFYAIGMFNADPTLMQYLMTAGTVFAIAMGAPGIPSSNITLLAPVLDQTGLSVEQINKVYTMVLPADRPLDMAQTGLNVAGDMLPAVHMDRKLIREKHALEDKAATGLTPQPASSAKKNAEPPKPKL